MGILVNRIKRKANHLFARGLARVVETCPPMADWLRSHDFRNKEAVVMRLNANFIRAESPAVCDGLRYELDLNHDLQRMIYFNAYERDLISAVLPLVNPNEVFFDVGANVGFYALHAARLMQTGCVYAFEPEPENFARLRKNCKLNGFEGRVRLHMLAVGNTVGREHSLSATEIQAGKISKAFPTCSIPKSRSKRQLSTISVGARA